MKILEKILVPTDFRQSADYAVEMAIYLSKIFNSEITLLHVLPNEFNEKGTNADLYTVAANQLDILREKINQQGVKTSDSIVTKGSLFEEMNKIADKQTVNLIMMGSGDKSDMDHFQLGTTTEKVMRRSNKPVWVVKRNSTSNINHIICPIDNSAPSKVALKNAIHLARGLKVELTVITVLESIADHILGLDINLEPESDKHNSEQEAEFEKFLSGFDFNGVIWTMKILKGRPHQEILKTVRSKKDSLLVMGTNGRSGFNKVLMGSVTEKVTRELPSSFITVKSEDIIHFQLEKEINDMDELYKEGRNLLTNGFAKEAINYFQRTLAINNLYAPAWVGLAFAYERTNDDEKAKHCHNKAKEIGERISNRKIEAEIRSKHWMFK